jgi:hypothetical protein
LKYRVIVGALSPSGRLRFEAGSDIVDLKTSEATGLVNADERAPDRISRARDGL